MSDDHVIIQFRRIREIRKKSCKRRYRRSRLDKYRLEIEMLSNNGGSWRQIANWLRQERRVKVHPTTIGRALDRWNDKQEDED